MKVIYICLLVLCAPFVNASEKSPLVERSQSSSSRLSKVTMSINNADDNSGNYGTLLNCQAIKEGARLLKPIPGMTPAGQEVVEQIVQSCFNGLTDKEKLYLGTQFLKGNYHLTSIWLNCWQIITGVCEPIGELAKLAVVVVSLWPNWDAGTATIVTAVLGMTALLFDKIAAYAANKVQSWERMINCSNAFKYGAPIEELV